MPAAMGRHRCRGALVVASLSTMMLFAADPVALRGAAAATGAVGAAGEGGDDALAGVHSYPLLLNAHGCSSSSFAQATMRRLLALHGRTWHKSPWVDDEAFRAAKNHWVHEEARHLPMADAYRTGMTRMLDETRSSGLWVITKLTDSQCWQCDKAGAYKDVVRKFVERGAKVVSVWRSNILDYEACKRHDCFTDQGSLRWKDNGTDATKAVCGKASDWVLRTYSSKNGSAPSFSDKRHARRQLTVVGLNPKTVAATLARGLGLGQYQARALRALGFKNFETIAVEALAAFEDSCEELEHSVAAWIKLLQSLGVDPVNATAVREDLRPQCGTRPLKPHSSVLYDYERVAAAIRASPNPQVRAMLREPAPAPAQARNDAEVDAPIVVDSGQSTGTAGVAAGGNDVPAGVGPHPLLISATGCSSSTWTEAITRRLVAAHGRKPAFVPKEAFKTEQNRWVREEAAKLPLPEAYRAGMKRMLDEEGRAGRSIVTKLTPCCTTSNCNKACNSNRAYERVVRDFVRRGSRVVSVWRSNILDFEICKVHDCFQQCKGCLRWKGNGTDATHAVCDDKASNWALKSYSSDGVSKPTFMDKRRARRELTTVSLKRDPQKVATMLAKGLQRGREQARMLHWLGFKNFETIAVEDLAAFEHSCDKIEHSVAAWARLLRSLGIEPVNKTAVRENLVAHDGCGERPLEKHSSLLYDYERVAAAVRASPNAQVRAMLRD